MSGGLGVGASGNFGGKLVIEDDTQATGLTSASLATSGGIYAAKDVIVNGDLTISDVTSPSGTAIDISSSSALTVSSTSGSNIDIESGGNMTLRADKVTVETETPSSTSTPHLSLLDGYMDIMKKTGLCDFEVCHRCDRGTVLPQELPRQGGTGGELGKQSSPRHI